MLRACIPTRGAPKAKKHRHRIIRRRYSFDPKEHLNEAAENFEMPEEVLELHSTEVVEALNNKRLRAIQEKRPYFVFLEGVSGSGKSQLTNGFKKHGFSAIQVPYIPLVDEIYGAHIPSTPIKKTEMKTRTKVHLLPHSQLMDAWGQRFEAALAEAKSAFGSESTVDNVIVVQRSFLTPHIYAPVFQPNIDETWLSYWIQKNDDFFRHNIASVVHCSTLPALVASRALDRFLDSNDHMKRIREALCEEDDPTRYIIEQKYTDLRPVYDYTLHSDAAGQAMTRLMTALGVNVQRIIRNFTDTIINETQDTFVHFTVPDYEYMKQNNIDPEERMQRLKESRFKYSEQERVARRIHDEFHSLEQDVKGTDLESILAQNLENMTKKLIEEHTAAGKPIPWEKLEELRLGFGVDEKINELEQEFDDPMYSEDHADFTGAQFKEMENIFKDLNKFDPPVTSQGETSNFDPDAAGALLEQLEKIIKTKK